MSFKYVSIEHIRTEDIKIGEDILVLDPEHPMYDELGKIYRVRETIAGSPRVSIIFDGEVYACSQAQIALV